VLCATSGQLHDRLVADTVATKSSSCSKKRAACCYKKYGKGSVDGEGPGRNHQNLHAWDYTEKNKQIHKSR
jgi:hypothetical protein